MKLTDTLGNSYEITLPKDIEGVSLAKGLAYQLELQNIDLWLEKKINDGTLDQDRNYYLYMLARAVSNFTNIDLNDVLQWNITDLLDENGDLFEGVLQSHLKKEEVEKTDGIENLLLYLSGQISTIMNSYKFEEPKQGSYTFSHGGVTYKIPWLVKSLVLGKKVFDKISIAQSVDVMKTKKYLATVSGYQEKLDNKKNVTFTSYLQIISILAIEEGTEYPNSPEAAAAYTQTQAVKFQDIDYSTANDIVFFLIGTGANLRRTQTTSIISTLLSMKSAMNNSVGMRTLGKGGVTIQ